MQRNRTFEGVVSTLLGAVAWGFSGTCVQYLFANTEMNALLLTTIRQLGAGLVFLAVLLLRDRDQLRAMVADRTLPELCDSRLRLDRPAPRRERSKSKIDARRAAAETFRLTSSVPQIELSTHSRRFFAKLFLYAFPKSTSS